MDNEHPAPALDLDALSIQEKEIILLELQSVVRSLPVLYLANPAITCHRCPHQKQPLNFCLQVCPTAGLD